MQVWVLTHTAYEETTILGIYTTVARGQAAADTDAAKHPGTPLGPVNWYADGQGNWCGDPYSYSLDVYTVDGEPR